MSRMNDPEEPKDSGTEVIDYDGLVPKANSSAPVYDKDAGQQTSKFRERWRKSQLGTKDCARKPGSEETGASSISKDALRHFREVETAALKTYEDTVAQLQTSLQPSVHLDLFRPFQQLVRTLAIAQFERDAKYGMECPKNPHYQLAVQQLSAKLEQMSHDLWVVLMKESLRQREEEKRELVLERQASLRRQEEERRADAAEKKREAEERRAEEQENKRRDEQRKFEAAEKQRRDEERKLGEVERTRRKEEITLQQGEQKAEEAEKRLIKAKKELEIIQMNRKEEEDKAENAKKVASEVTKKLEALQRQLIEARRMLEETQRKQVKAQKIFKMEKAENHAEVVNSNGLEKAKPSEARVSRGAPTPALTPFSRKQENKLPQRDTASKAYGFSNSPSQPTPTDVGKVIPSSELAIHLGLTRTRVGFIIPATGQLSVVADVKNCLYSKNLRYAVAFSPDEVNGLGNPAVDFQGSILFDPPDKPHTVIINGSQTQLRLQEILARFFLCLKHKAEIVLKTYFPKCVIAVPQCLNDMQRCCIEDAATISGFEGIQLVNDTNAIAVAFVVDSHKRLGNIVVVNGSEEIFDIASFNFNSGALQCQNVTGPYFRTDDEEKGSIELRIVKKALFGENPAEKYFTPKELGVSPSSPNTTYLMLEGPCRALEDYRRAVYKNTAGRKDGIIYIDSHDVLRGAAYLCCLRSRDPCNVILHLWTEKLQACRETRLEKLLQEVEDNIISQEKRIAKRSKIQQRGGALSANEVLRHCEALSSEYANTLHHARMDVLNMMVQLQLELPRLKASTQRKEYESHMEIIHGQLKKADLSMEELCSLKNEIMTMISDL